MQVSFIDVSRPYFNARTTNEHLVYVELPPEDPDHGGGICGRLDVHMYRTRRAADGWHCKCSGSMEEFGFGVGQSSARIFRHAERHLCCLVHRDDFTSVGPKSSLDWFKKQMETV